jgi:hypothetical protein
MNGKRRPRTWLIDSEISCRVLCLHWLALNDVSQFETKNVSKTSTHQSQPKDMKIERGCHCRSPYKGKSFSYVTSMGSFILLQLNCFYIHSDCNIPVLFDCCFTWWYIHEMCPLKNVRPLFPRNGTNSNPSPLAPFLFFQPDKKSYSTTE